MTELTPFAHYIYRLAWDCYIIVISGTALGILGAFCIHTLVELYGKKK